MYSRKAGVFCGPSNPSKWEAEIWGWLEVRRSATLQYTVNQRTEVRFASFLSSGFTTVINPPERKLAKHTSVQCPHWACWQEYGHSGGTQGRLGVERHQLCLKDTSLSAKWHRQAAVGHWISLCLWSVVGWLIVYQDGIYLNPGHSLRP